MKSVTSPREMIDDFLKPKLCGRKSTGFVLPWKTLRVHTFLLSCSLYCGPRYLSNLDSEYLVKPLSTSRLLERY